jgi:hypothetical protein
MTPKPDFTMSTQPPPVAPSSVAPCSASDGTDLLCFALYGRRAEPTDWIGGSEAKMLRDAAKEIAVLRSRALVAVDAVGHWMPAMDHCDKTTADAIRALRDVCGWKKTSPNVGGQPRDEPATESTKKTP